MTNPTRVYLAADHDAPIRAIAAVETPTFLGGTADKLHISFDGRLFHPVLFKVQRSYRDTYSGIIQHPELGKQPLEFDGNAMTLNGIDYSLDETATVGDFAPAAPIMDIISLVETHLGYYVIAQNEMDNTDHHYLDGTPLHNTGGFHARSGDVVAEETYAEGYRYLVTGSNLFRSEQTATFDGRPATQLNVSEYEVTFASDLTTVTVTKK